MPSFTGSLSPRLSRLCVCHPLFSTSGWESLCRVLYRKVNFLREGLSVGLLHRFGAWHTIIGQPLQASCNPILHSYQFSSVAQTCLTLCDPMNRSMPGLPVHHQLLFSSSSLSAIRVVSSAYLKLLIFLPAILIPACASSSPAFLMMYSA